MRRVHRWEDWERERLHDAAGRFPIRRIARWMGRTPTAALVYYRRTHEPALSTLACHAAGMSINDCAVALGISRRSIHRWITRGLLRAECYTAISRSFYTVDSLELELFVRTVGGLLHLHPVGDWKEVYTEAQRDLHTRYIDRDAAAELFHISKYMLVPRRYRWPERYGFPLPALQAEGRVWYALSDLRDWLKSAPPECRTARALQVLGLEEDL